MPKTIMVPTSAEVWAVIRARHPDMVVFETDSDPDDRYSTGMRRMYTSYGFKHCPDHPVIAGLTTWEQSTVSPSERKNVKHEYWLCVGEDD